MLKWDAAGALEEAVRRIRDGETVAFPTETVYGLGARYDSEPAVRRIFKAKGRPSDNPLIVHVDSIGAARALAGDWTPLADALAKMFWPGPLTLVVRRASAVPDAVTAGLNTVALRMPAHPCALGLIAGAGPIAAPSANRSGRPSPTRAGHVARDLDGRIPLVLDGGPCKKGLESTVLDVTGEVPVILRPGHVTPEAITAAAGGVRVSPGVMAPLPEGAIAASPGLLHRHYAPESRVVVYRGGEAAVHARMMQDYARLRAAGHRPLLVGTGEFRGMDAQRVRDADDFAARFYSILLDSERDRTHILLQGMDDRGVGLALMDRALRAAGFAVENVDGL